jgi:hypothetical protein
MTFFYDLNKRLADLAKKQDLNESVGSTSGFLEGSTGDYSAKKAAAGKDIGKPGKMFSKIAKSAGSKYGSKAAGERVAGAVLNKLRHPTEESTVPMTPKQKSFAKLAPPTDKITFADKIVGAKKEVDEVLGDVAAKAMKAAVGKQTVADEGNAFTGKLKSTPPGGKFKMGNKEFKDTSTIEEKKKEPRSKGTAFDKEHMDKVRKEKEAETHSRYDVKDTGYSKRYTRKEEPEAEKDDEVSDQPKTKGRPKGSKRAIGAKGPTGNSKLMKKDSIKEMDSVTLTDKGEYDQEGESAKSDIKTIVRHAQALHKILGDNDNLPEWVQAKLSKIEGMMTAVDDYMQNHADEQGEEEIAEKAVSKKQQKFMGMVHAAQKGEKPASKEVGKVAKSMGKKDATDFASTKHKGLPEKVKEADAEEPKEKKSSGGYNFGGGIYESINSKVENMISEGMSVNISVDEQGKKSISVNATEEDAEALATLLKMAGMGGQSREGSCPTCNQAPCGCEEELDENSPDWPTNTETSDNALQYSGGLNGPKSTGQTTIPVIASQLRRQVSMEESVKLENDLFRLYQNYKTQ